MKRIKLEVLGLEVPVGILRSYTDHGYVDDVLKTVRRIEKKHDFFQFLLFGGRKTYDLMPTGCCYVANPLLLNTHVHIFYEDLVDEHLNIRNRAHEETHALEKLGRLDVLQNELAREGRSVNLSSLPEEILADVGAVHALFKRGLPADFDNGLIDASRIYFFGV